MKDRREDHETVIKRAKKAVPGRLPAISLGAHPTRRIPHVLLATHVGNARKLGVLQTSWDDFELL